MPIASINPATGETLEEFSAFDDAEIEKRLSRAEQAFRNYRRTTLVDRAELLHAVSELLFQEKQRFAEIITLEMGKLFRDSVAEIEKCARGCRFYAENGARFLEEEPAQTDAAESYVEYQPLGPVLAVMPWNFPFWQVFRFAAPALIAGNVGLLKHASNVPQCALAIEEIFMSAGFPKGAFQTLLIGSDAVEGILNDPRVVAATLTGSEPAGRSVARAVRRSAQRCRSGRGGDGGTSPAPEWHRGRIERSRHHAARIGPDRRLRCRLRVLPRPGGAASGPTAGYSPARPASGRHRDLPGIVGPSPSGNRRCPSGHAG